MSSDQPELDDYLTLFDQYGDKIEFAYREAPGDAYELLFERVIRLLTRPSAFNLTLPEPFRSTAYRYLARDEETVEQLSDRDTRHFMLCEVYDYIMLTGGLARRRAQAGQG